MGAKHKLSGARLTGTTSQPPDVVLAIASEVAGHTTVDSWKLKKSVVVQPTERTADSQHFSIGVPKHIDQRPIMQFRCQVTADGSGSEIATEIELFRTSQSTVAGFIPAGPKSLEGYPWYQQYMRNLEAAILAKDPGATLRVVEREGR